MEELLKPNLQKVLDALLDEDLEKRETQTIGECLEYTLKNGLLMELVAYGKSDRPEGLFEIVLKFINFLIFDVQATHLLNMQEIHPAVMQLLVHIEYSIKNNMLLHPIPNQYDGDEEDVEDVLETNNQIKMR